MMQNGCIKIKKRTTNTDNMGKLFPAFSKKAGQVVTVFAFAPTTKTTL